MGNPDNKNYPNQVEVAVSKKNTAEFYENNPAENFAGKIKRKVSNVIDKVSRFFNLKKDWQEIKTGVKYEVNRVINGAKKVFSGSRKSHEINPEKIIKDLTVSGVSSPEEYKKTMLDYIKNGDEKWGNEPSWKKERSRVMKELELVREKWNLNEEFINAQDKLYKTNNPDEAKILIDKLLNTGFLTWDDPDLWKTLMRLSNNKVVFHRNDMALSQKEIFKKVQKAIELIWSEEMVDKWHIRNGNYRIKNNKESPQNTKLVA